MPPTGATGDPGTPAMMASMSYPLLQGVIDPNNVNNQINMETSPPIDSYGSQELSTQGINIFPKQLVLPEHYTEPGRGVEGAFGPLGPQLPLPNLAPFISMKNASYSSISENTRVDGHGHAHHHIVMMAKDSHGRPHVIEATVF